MKNSGLESDATPQIGGAEDLAASHDVADLADVVDVDERFPSSKIKSSGLPTSTVPSS